MTTNMTDLRTELNYLLHEKAGEVSMCWSDVDKAGTFDSSKAISIVEEALTSIEKLIEERYVEKVGNVDEKKPPLGEILRKENAQFNITDEKEGKV